MTLPVLEPLDVRIPQWDLNSVIARLCPLCGIDQPVVLERPDKLPVSFCNSCGCWYVAKLPSLSDIKKLYDGYYYDHRPTDLSEKSITNMFERAYDMSQTDWQLQSLSKILGGLKGKRIFDVGCGTGIFLLSARYKGADVVGCDLSPEACDFANKKLGIRVYQSDLISCMSSVDHVDAIVMRDFIEHPVDPLKDLKAAINILKPGGLLLIHTPNGGEAGAAIDVARDWVGFRVDLEHFQYFSTYTINWIARIFNMRIERLDAFGFPGLDGIDEFPRRRLQTGDRVRDIAKKIPYLRTVVKAFRSAKTVVLGGPIDPRLGFYHLFAVLQKV